MSQTASQIQVWRDGRIEDAVTCMCKFSMCLCLSPSNALILLLLHSFLVMTALLLAELELQRDVIPMGNVSEVQYHNRCNSVTQRGESV